MSFTAIIGITESPERNEITIGQGISLGTSFCSHRDDSTCICSYSECVMVVVDVFSLPYLETSAATGENVEAAVSTLLNRVMLHVDEIIDVTNKYISVVNGNTIKWMKYEAVDDAEDDGRKRNGCAC